MLTISDVAYEEVNKDMGHGERNKSMKEIASRHRYEEDHLKDYDSDKNHNQKFFNRPPSASHHQSTKSKSKHKLKSDVTHPPRKNSLCEISPNNLQNTESNTASDDSNNSGTETKRGHKRKRNQQDESFKELSDRKKRLEMQLQALDAEEAAQSGKRKKCRNPSHHYQEGQVKSVRIKQEPASDNESNVRTKKIRNDLHLRHDTQKSSSDGDQRKHKAKYTNKKHSVKVKQESHDDADRHKKQNSKHDRRIHLAKIKQEDGDADNDSRIRRKAEINHRIYANRIKQEQDTSSHSRHANHSNFRRRNTVGTSDAENMEWGRPDQDGPAKKDVKEKEKPNFETSGKLAEDTNTFNGVVIKYNEPSEACKPRRRWRLYPFKGNDSLPFIPIHRQSAYLLGRSRLIADIPIDHPSCSKQHAVLQFRLIPYTREDGSKGRNVRPYIIDLGSSNGTFLNNKPIESRRYMELFERDVLKFGFSSRVYVILHEESKGDKDEEDEGVIEESPS